MSVLECVHHHHEGENGCAVDGQHASNLGADSLGRLAELQRLMAVRSWSRFGTSRRFL